MAFSVRNFNLPNVTLPTIPDVVYRLCFKIVLSNSRNITKTIEYNAGIKHKFNADISSIQVPDTLLKSKDLI
jgi:hypothetical protein